MKWISLFLLTWTGSFCAQAQSNVMTSANEIRYMVTYEPTTSVYTAWLVPDYNTPNANNPETEDRGATAQFSLKVPKDFVLTQVGDIRGSWDKKPYRLEAPQDFAGSPDWVYYVIGKAPQETNYGPFIRNEPVALFTFKGKGGNAEQVQVLSIDDPFVPFAETNMALNVRNSFYSRSGQRSAMTARPLEQMIGVVRLGEVLKKKQAELGVELLNTQEDIATLSMQAYPNPAVDIVNVKYFSAVEQPGVQLELLDMQGNIRQNTVLNAKIGFNNARFTVANLPGGVYFVRSVVQGQRVTRKVVKQ